MKLGTENKKQTIAAAVLGLVFVLVGAHAFFQLSSTNASTPTVAADPYEQTGLSNTKPHKAPTSVKKAAGRTPQSLDPTLHLDQLAAAEQIKYEGSGRNIFVAQAEVTIPTPQGTGATDVAKKEDPIYKAPVPPQAPPIPLKFFGFASHPGEPKKIFLSKGDDVFIAGEGEIVDRRYKVLKISNTSVEIQDVVNSGPPQNIPLTQAPS